MPNEESDNQNQTAPAGSDTPAPPTSGLGGALKIAGGKGLPGIAMAVGGKKIIIPGMIILVFLFIAVFFLVSSIALYATRLGAVPGYAGTWSGGNVTCPDTKGWGAQEVVAVPDISAAKLTETIDAQFTSYHPKSKFSTNQNDPMEGAGYGAEGLTLGIGAIAVPNNETRFPLYRTVLDIPGVGLRVAVDHGGAIKERAPLNPDGWKYDHFDIFAGWGDAGTNAGAHMIPGTEMNGGSKLITGVKVYVFETSKEALKRVVLNYNTQAECITANKSYGGDIVGVAMSQMGNEDYHRYNGHYRAWCADFVSWVLQKSGHNLSQMPSPSQFIGYFSKNGVWISSPKPEQYAPGDVVLFGNASSNYGTHIGIIKAVNPEGLIFTTIEGNVGRTSNKSGMSSVKSYTRPMNTDKSAKYYVKGIGKFN